MTMRRKRRLTSPTLGDKGLLAVFAMGLCARACGFSLPALTHQTGVSGLSSSRLPAKISFQGDTTARSEFDAPAHHVQEWLATPSASDVHLLGSIDAMEKDEGVWECLQPRIDFMGLDLQPVFVHRISRRSLSSTSNGSFVEVRVIDSRTDILGTGNASQAVGSLLSNAKFTGQSRFRVEQHPRADVAVMEVDLELGLHVPLPPFVLLPPGFNSIGSSIIKRTGKSRTEELLKDMERAYFRWAAELESTASD